MSYKTPKEFIKASRAGKFEGTIAMDNDSVSGWSSGDMLFDFPPEDLLCAFLDDLKVDWDPAYAEFSPYIVKIKRRMK
jgi:hypothetical protein